MDSGSRSTGAGDYRGEARELPRPGEVICGKYRLDSVLGAGGMGVVMAALDTSLGRSVAIKFLAPHRASREGAVARFVREARAAAAIQSEHVVRVFEVSTLPNGAPFIVMEHLRGADLVHVLGQRGVLPIDEACDLLLQACEALGEAHGLGIVHRDLKPQNLFLTQRPDGSHCVKVLDFGISKTVDDGAPNLTSTDMVMGTPLYMSPEQVRSLKNVDARADIWALGSILFELLTMSPVFQAPSASALCAMIAMDPPTPLRVRRPQAPPELEGVILRCLHKDPAGRFQDVAALADALVPFASERGRLSAARISRVVRSGTGPVPFGQPSSGAGSFSRPPAHVLELGMASTTGMGTTRSDPPGPPFVPSTAGSPRTAPGPSLLPAAPHPTTQSTWHQTNMTGQKQASSGAHVAVLGVLAGLAALALIAGVAWYFVIRQGASATTSETLEAGVPGAMFSGAPAPIPTPSAQPTVSATSSATALPPSPKPGPAPQKDGGAPVQKDGGAPAQKDGGAPAPTPPSPDKEEQERIAAMGRAAEAQCRNHRQQMTTFARDDATRQRAATQAKTFMCRGMASSSCERQVCLEACLVLGDQPCIQNMRFVIDHGPAPKY